MPQTRRSLIWGLIGLLFALAFIRSLAPEGTERAVRRLFDARVVEEDRIATEKKELDKVKEALQRERKALERWKEELDQKREQVEKVEKERQSHRREVEELAVVHRDDPDAYTDGAKSREDSGEKLEPADEKEGTEEVPTDSSSESASNPELDLVDAPAESLSDNECPIIVAPEFASAGLGTQIKHIWTSLSLTLAIRNACMVIPPVVSSDGMAMFRPVPFHQVFNLPELSRTGLRFVPLRTCHKHGLSTVFDDSGAESAIVKNFAAYVKESHPHLVEESTLVHGDSKGYRFLESQNVREDVTVVAKYVRGKLPKEAGRHCVGMGRMRAPVAINPDVLEHFVSAMEVVDYVEQKFPRANETLFVKLRWNSAHCDKARTDDWTVCVFSDNVVPVDEYVFAIAHAARVANAKNIYLSAPTHVPDDVSEYFANHLNTLDPVLLDVDGDFFTANIIERELAVRAVRFVPDGGAWGDAVQKSRKSQIPHLYEENVNSLNIIQEWKHAGWPKESLLLKGFVAKPIEKSKDELSGVAVPVVEMAGVPPTAAVQHVRDEQGTVSFPETIPNAAGDPPAAAREHRQHGHVTESLPEAIPNAVPAAYAWNQPQEHQNVQVPATNFIEESRPHEYVPPPHYVPSDDDDDDIRQLVAQGIAPLEVQTSGHLDSAQVEPNHPQPLAAAAEVTVPQPVS